MRASLLVVAVLLLVAGGLISAGLLRVPQEKEVLRIGSKSLSMTQERQPDRRIGYGLLVIGAIVLVVGASRKA
jgi:hypothetical protein